MATLEEARAAVSARLAKYKERKPTRVAYLGDGRGYSTSNIVVSGEPGYYWARETQDGGKPFKILNRNPNLGIKFNLPVMLGYPDDQPGTEQILGIHFGGIDTTATGTSAISGAGPHHTQHEWGGGDEVYIDQRQFLPGLVKPTSPASMRVKINPFHHAAKGGWLMFDGATTKELDGYKPESDYRYLLICLDPGTNQIVYRGGNVFTPDLSIDSIISNSAKTTFRHIPVPPADEIPLAAVLLEPDTATIDWNLNGVNNLAPMRLMFSTPETDILDRLERLERASGVTGGVPTRGAESHAKANNLPGLIDARINRVVHQRGATLPSLLVGEIGYDDDDNTLYVGSASGNQAISGGGGGGGTNALSALSDVDAEASTLATNAVLQFVEGDDVWRPVTEPSFDGVRINEDSVVIDATQIHFDVANYFTPVVVKRTSDEFARFGGASGGNYYLEINHDFIDGASLIVYDAVGSGEALLAVDTANTQVGVGTNSPSALLHVIDRTTDGTPGFILENDSDNDTIMEINNTGGGTGDARLVIDAEGSGDHLYIEQNYAGTGTLQNNGGSFRIIVQDIVGTGTRTAALYGPVTTVFNDDGISANFRVEGSSDAYALYIQGSTDRVGIGESSPSYKLDVSGTFRTTGDAYFGDQVGIGTTTVPSWTAGTTLVELKGSTPRLLFTSDRDSGGGFTVPMMTVGISNSVGDAALSEIGILGNSGTNTLTYLYIGDAYDDNAVRIYPTKKVAVYNNLYPGTDNSYDLGESGNRWDDVYATNGTIQTSDGTMKVYEASDRGVDFIMKLKPVKYWFRDGKGNPKTTRRPHYGLVAQDVESAMNELGMDDFAGLIKSEHGYGLRYTEFIAIIIRALQEQQVEIDRLKGNVK